MLGRAVSGRMSQPTAAAAAPPKRCVAIINPAGANGKSKKLWKELVGDVSSQLSANGFALEEQFTTPEPGSAARLASQAAALRAEVVLAVGGDGTIHEVRGCARQSGECTACATTHLPRLVGFARCLFLSILS